MSASLPATPTPFEPCMDDAFDILRTEMGADAARLLNTWHIRTANAGEILLHIGQTNRVGLVIHGLLKTVVPFPDGQSPTIRYMQRGNVFGLSSLFHATSIRIEVVERASVIELDGSVLTELAKEMPEVAWFVARELAFETTRLPSVIEEFGFASMRERVAAHLVRLAGCHQKQGRRAINVTQEGLADCVGTSREVVARCLRSFRKEGLVAAARGVIYILDESGLARVASRLESESLTDGSEFRLPKTN